MSEHEQFDAAILRKIGRCAAKIADAGGPAMHDQEIFIPVASAYYKRLGESLVRLRAKGLLECAPNPMRCRWHAMLTELGVAEYEALKTTGGRDAGMSHKGLSRGRYTKAEYIRWMKNKNAWLRRLKAYAAMPGYADIHHVGAWHEGSAVMWTSVTYGQSRR
jgi:hypothetical protein